MLQAADIAAALRQHLPAEYHSAIPHLAQVLAEASTGAVSPAEAQASLPGLADALRALAGREVQTNNALITFGSGNQLGAVTIRDVAGRDVITLHFNLGVQQNINVSGDATVGKIVGEEINTGGGDYAEGSIDKREGTFVEDSTIRYVVSGDVSNTTNIFYTAEQANRAANIEEATTTFSEATRKHITGDLWSAKRLYEKTLSLDPFYPQAEEKLKLVKHQLEKYVPQCRMNPPKPPSLSMFILNLLTLIGFLFLLIDLVLVNNPLMAAFYSFILFLLLLPLAILLFVKIRSGFDRRQ
jgi:hypothetical protein